MRQSCNVPGCREIMNALLAVDDNGDPHASAQWTLSRFVPKCGTGHLDYKAAAKFAMEGLFSAGEVERKKLTRWQLAACSYFGRRVRSPRSADAFASSRPTRDHHLYAPPLLSFGCFVMSTDHTLVCRLSICRMASLTSLRLGSDWIDSGPIHSCCCLLSRRRVIDGRAG